MKSNTQTSMEQTTQIACSEGEGEDLQAFLETLGPFPDDLKWTEFPEPSLLNFNGIDPKTLFLLRKLHVVMRENEFLRKTNEIWQQHREKTGDVLKEAVDRIVRLMEIIALETAVQENMAKSEGTIAKELEDKWEHNGNEIPLKDQEIDDLQKHTEINQHVEKEKTYEREAEEEEDENDTEITGEGASRKLKKWLMGVVSVLVLSLFIVTSFFLSIVAAFSSTVSPDLVKLCRFLHFWLFGSASTFLMWIGGANIFETGIDVNQLDSCKHLIIANHHSRNDWQILVSLFMKYRMSQLAVIMSHMIKTTCFAPIAITTGNFLLPRKKQAHKTLDLLREFCKNVFLNNAKYLFVFPEGQTIQGDEAKRIRNTNFAEEHGLRILDHVNYPRHAGLRVILEEGGAKHHLDESDKIKYILDITLFYPNVQYNFLRYTFNNWPDKHLIIHYDLHRIEDVPKAELKGWLYDNFLIKEGRIAEWRETGAVPASIAENLREFQFPKMAIMTGLLLMVTIFTVFCGLITLGIKKIGWLWTLGVFTGATISSVASWKFPRVTRVAGLVCIGIAALVKWWTL